jgi:cell division protein FtsW
MPRVKTDQILFFVILALTGFGVVMLYSASSVVADLRYHYAPYHFVVRQLFWIALSLVVMVSLKQFDYRRLNTQACAFCALGVVLTLLVAVYFVDARSHRWFRLPAGIGSFQPSEFAKPALILFIAVFLARRNQIINHRRSLMQAVLVIAMLGFLVVASDLGTALVPVITALVVFWVAGLERRYMMYAAVAGVLLVSTAIVTKGYRLGRVISFVDPDYSLIGKIDASGKIRAYVQSSTSVKDAGYQARQSRIAIGTGGILGVGLMEGRQKLLFLPEAHTDFIYATIGEELGLWGASAVLAGFLVILWRGARLFVLARDPFGKYLALGATVAIVVQALCNISIALDMAPTKGFGLPLISFGGSSLLSTMISLGMLLSVSEHEG